MTQTITSNGRRRAVVAGAFAAVLAVGFNPTAADAAVRRPRGYATGPSRLQQVQAIADSSGWDWRSAGATFVIGFHPAACCHWGVYDPARARSYIGPTAFATPEVLRYVVLHETAHAWQFRAKAPQPLMGDYARWGYRGVPGLEAGADCIARRWGAARNLGHYWHCPDGALAVAARELAGGVAASR
jgi:hypothetical protein